MITKKYIDGISFLTDDSEQEIAFYSKFTDRIRYVQNIINNVNCVGCIEIPCVNSETGEPIDFITSQTGL